MSVRSINSAKIMFGMVSVPVKIYMAAKAETVAFHMLTPSGNRVEQKLQDAVTKEQVEYADCDRGYEVTSDKCLRFTREELKTLDANCEAKEIVIMEFVDEEYIDPIAIEKSYYLGPDKGGAKGYSLLSEALKCKHKVAVAQWNSRGREHLVVIKPYKNGLVLHQMFYSTEVVRFDEIDFEVKPLNDSERKAACKLLLAMSSETCNLSKYSDGYQARVKKAVETKLGGGTIVAITLKSDKGLSSDDFVALLEKSAEALKNNPSRGG
jgi:DNA end-binding protein Ku